MIINSFRSIIIFILFSTHALCQTNFKETLVTTQEERLETPYEFGNYWPKFKAVDYDNDGKLELFTGISFIHYLPGLELAIDNYVSIVDNSPSDNVVEFTFAAPPNEVLAIEDVNNDGHLELFVLNKQSLILQVYSNLNGDRHFYEIGLGFNGYDKINFLDVDKDGLKDFVLGNSKSLVVMKNSGLYITSSLNVILFQYDYKGFTEQFGTSDLKIADFNNDGEPDIFNGATFFYTVNNKIGAKISEPLFKDGKYYCLKNCILSNYDNDGYPNVSGSISGNDFGLFVSAVVNNEQVTQIIHFSYDGIDWDNNGLEDRIISNQGRVFCANQFSFSPKPGSTFSYDAHYPVKYAGDLNQDGNVDMFVENKGELYLYQPQNTTLNNKPDLPTNMVFDLQSNQLEVKWNRAKDKETPDSLLKYNLSLTGTDALGNLVNLLSSDAISTDSNTFYGTTFPAGTTRKQSDKFKFKYINEYFTNVGNDTSMTITFQQDVKDIKAYLIVMDNGGQMAGPLIDSTNIHYNIFEESSITIGKELKDYPSFKIADLNSDSQLDVLLSEKIYGNKNTTSGGKAYLYSGQSKEVTHFALYNTDSSFFIANISDVNNDGKLDFVTIHPQKDEFLLSLNAGDFIFNTALSSSLTNVRPPGYTTSYQEVPMLDYDSDGDVDCFVSDQGLEEASDQDDLYFIQLNNKGDFTGKIGQKHDILHSSDFNDDGENDLLILNYESVPKLEMWIKNDTNYTYKQYLQDFSILSLTSKDVQFERIDLDADGSFELIVREPTVGSTVVYVRDRFGNWDARFNFSGRVVFFDMNNDGFVDYFDFVTLSISKAIGEMKYVSGNWISYSVLLDILDPISFQIKDRNETVKMSCSALDLNKDSLSDLLFSTKNGLQFYRNNLGAFKNKAPSIPEALISSSNEDVATLSWNKSKDPDNEKVGLFYNVQVWNKETGEFLTPVHSMEDGTLLLPGSYSSVINRFVLRDLKDGVYYWKVQAIDQSHLPSAFSVTDSFSVVLKPTITFQTAICNFDTAVYAVSPPSKHYKWESTAGVVLGNNDTSVTIKWTRDGNQKLYVTNTKFSLSDSTEETILPNPIPTISYYFPEAGSAFKAAFRTDSGQSIQSYSWKINEVHYTTPSPNRTFSQGRYDASVLVKYSNGCENSYKKIFDLDYPRITTDQKIVCGNSDITYTATPSGLNNNWEVFGGAVLYSSNDKVIVNWFPSSGQNRHIKLVNKDNLYSDSLSVIVFPLPVADFIVPDDIGINSLIQFQNTSSDSVMTYSWDFDEVGNFSKDKNPTVSFSNPGQHTVTLKVSMANQCENTVSKIVLVSNDISPIMVSNFLTPNADGKNDYLYIENLDRHPENEVRLTNAWGTEVFNQTNYQNDWDLKKDDAYIPAGDYLCVVELKRFGKKFEKIVTVTK